MEFGRKKKKKTRGKFIAIALPPEKVKSLSQLDHKHAFHCTSSWSSFKPNDNEAQSGGTLETLRVWLEWRRRRRRRRERRGAGRHLCARVCARADGKRRHISDDRDCNQ